MDDTYIIPVFLAIAEADGTEVEWFMEETQKHGFMMRGDTSDPETLAAIKTWMGTLLRFFDKHMQ